MTGTALQVFYNLNSLNKQVTEITENYKKQLAEHIKSALDAKNISNLSGKEKICVSLWFEFSLVSSEVLIG